MPKAKRRHDNTIIKGLRSIELFRDGYDPIDIAKIMKVSRMTVFRYFRAGGERSPDDWKAHIAAKYRGKGGKKKVIVEV